MHTLSEVSLLNNMENTDDFKNGSSTVIIVVINIIVLLLLFKLNTTPNLLIGGKPTIFEHLGNR